MNRLIIIAALLLLPLQALAVGTGPNLFSSGGLLSGCADQQVMTWIDANSAWECADPPGASGGEANRLASPDVGSEVDLINSVPLTGVNLNLRSFEADDFAVVSNIISINDTNWASQTEVNLKAPLADPTFTGTVTIPTPFTVGGVSMTSTAAELNLLDGVTALSGADGVIITGTIATTNAVVTVDASDDLVEEGTLTWNVTPATCTGDGNGGALTVNGSDQIVCSADDGGAGGTAFSALTTSTNTTADMTVGTGASLLVSGSGTIAATTAAALAANPNNCSASQAPRGIAANGNAEDCTDYEEELTDSAGLVAALSDETGSASGTPLAVFNQAPTLSGKITRNVVAVNDDDCTGEQGLYWYDTTDSAFEFCNANSGTPTVLGGGSGLWTDGTAEIYPADSADNVCDDTSCTDWSISPAGAITADSITDSDGTSLWTIPTTGAALFQSVGDEDAGNLWSIDTAGDATFNSVAVSASATPNLLLVDSTTSGEGKIEVSDAAGPESEMQFWVDEGTGTATEYMTLDGVGETIDLLKPVDITGVTTIGNGTSPGDVRILEGSGGGANYVSIIAPATLASNRICTLEDDDTPFDGCITSGGGMTSWNLDGDNTDPQTITNTNTALIAGTAPISTVAAATDTVTVSLDANGVDASHLAATLTMGATDLVDFTAWENTDANGLIAPTAATSCANVATEGQVCWEADADALWVGDGAAPPTQIGAGGSGDVTDVGDCAGPACFTSGSPDAALTFNNATSGTVTLQTVAGALGTVTASLPAETGTILTSASTIDATSVETTLIRDVEIDIGAGAWTLNATTPPTESTIGTTFVRDILNFDYQTADNNVSIEIEIPTIYDNTVAPTLNVVWSSTAITGDVCWCAEATSVIDSGDNTPTPPASDCTSTLVDGTTTDRNETSITLAGGDFVAGGGGLIHLFRDQDESETGCGAGDDDMAAVASLHSAKLTFQVSE